LEDQKRDFVVKRPEKYGGTVKFKKYAEVEKAFADKKLSSIDLKQALAEEIIKIIGPLRKKLEENLKLLKDAYP
jgi:tyrosyl-tRNA synthetase